MTGSDDARLSPLKRTMTSVRTPELKEYIAAVAARKWSVILVTLVVVLIACGYQSQQTPVYASEAQVLVAPLQYNAGEIGDGTAPNMDTEENVLASMAIAERVEKAVDGAPTPANLLSHLSVTVPPNTEILSIVYSSTDREMAQRVAQAFAESYLDYRRDQAVGELLATLEPLQRRMQRIDDQMATLEEQIAVETDPGTLATLRTEVTSLAGQKALLQQELTQLTPPANLRVGEVLQPAPLPTQPAGRGLIFTGALAFAAGLALGIALALLRHRLSDVIRAPEDLERATDIRVLGIIPSVRRSRRLRRTSPLLDGSIDARVGEAFKTLRANVAYASLRTASKVILVSSASGGEGKSTVSLNLGSALAALGKTVILIGADLRRPTLDEAVGVQRQGLSEILRGATDLDDVLVPTHKAGLIILPPGKRTPNPVELLGGTKLDEVIDELRARADFILIDSAPLLAVADTITLARVADGVLLVVDSRRTTVGTVQMALHQLELSGVPILGAVLNNALRAPVVEKTYGSYLSSEEEVPLVSRNDPAGIAEALEQRARLNADGAVAPPPPAPAPPASAPVRRGRIRGGAPR
jgi:succinoglycan biosynthesis transport protein ExoP